MENLNNYARADVHNDMAGTAVAARVWKRPGGR